MNDMKQITINKNRGWRGLTEVAILNEEKDLTTKHIFSFSQEMWDDLIFRHLIVIASEEYYYVIHFEDPDNRLPRQDQQRSVLIKNFTADITNVNKIKLEEWVDTEVAVYNPIIHFRRNRNNHTTSDWNYIGIRVIPEI